MVRLSLLFEYFLKNYVVGDIFMLYKLMMFWLNLL